MLTDKKIAILTDNGFEESELKNPKEVLEEEGAIVDIVSPQEDYVKAWNHGDWSIELPVDVKIADAHPDDYDGLMLPGGVINPDKLRRNQLCIGFAKSFMKSGKPVAAICHGPQLLIETGLLKDKNMTSFPSLKTDLINAGAHWQNEEVVTDQGLVTSRSPDDLAAFNEKMVEEFQEGIHSKRKNK